MYGIDSLEKEMNYKNFPEVDLRLNKHLSESNKKLQKGHSKNLDSVKIDVYRQ